MTELVIAAVSSTTLSTPPSTSPLTTPSTPPSTSPSPPPSDPSSPSSILDRILAWLSKYSYHRDPDVLLHKALFYLTLLRSVFKWLLHFLKVRSLTVRVRSQLRAFLADSSQEMTLRVPRSSRRRSRRHSTPNRAPLAPRVGSRPHSPLAATAPLLQLGDGGFVHPMFPWRSIPGLPDGVARWLLGGHMGVSRQQLMQSMLLQDDLDEVSVHPVCSLLDPGTMTMTTNFSGSRSGSESEEE